MTSLEPGHLEKLRCFELEVINSFLQPGLNVMDIGGGTGYQARIMAEKSCNVTSVDILPLGARARYFPVQSYDGVNLPARSESVDLIFSSNVLEHVTDLPGLLADMRRVLKKDGIAIHILPSPTWRLWTSICYYLRVLKKSLDKTKGDPGTDKTGTPSRNAESRSKRMQRILPACRSLITYPFKPHGEFPNAITELYHYRQRAWVNQFQQNGFKIETVFSSGIFYTGHAIFPNLSYDLRKVMSRVLGSSCNVFILKKTGTFSI
jgi:ubiquinone/menaquinone biosynthesis C-methylase UbiE